MSMHVVRLETGPTVSPSQLHHFYTNNNICEGGYGEDVAARPFLRSSIVVVAYHEDEIVALARALFDGLAAEIVEFCVACEWQGPDLVYGNSLLIEKDERGVGKLVGEVLLRELEAMGPATGAVSRVPRRQCRHLPEADRVVSSS